MIPLEQGPNVDEFYLSFEVLGDEENVVVPYVFSESEFEAVQVTGEESADIGLKTFDEIIVIFSEFRFSLLIGFQILLKGITKPI